MRAPSKQRLLATFRDLTPQGANLIRALAKSRDDAEQLQVLVESGRLPQTEKYVRSMYSSPYDSRLWRTTVALSGIDEVIGGFGIEALGPPEGRAPYAPPYEYVNMGDGWAMTLIYKRDTDAISIGAPNDIAERHGARWEGDYW